MIQYPHMENGIRLAALLGLSAAAMACTHHSASLPERPNIIYIMSDDHAYQAISAYGGILKNLAPTPNIDRIARDGMRFDRCLVTNSISGPCRAVVLTGKYSHVNGYLTNDGQEPFDTSQQTFPKLLKASGYTTAMIGKWHLGSLPSGFDHWEILPGQGSYYNPDFISKEGTHREQGYVTGIITRKCIDWLRQIKDSGHPFLLMMHHKAPHREWEPGPDELSLYKDVTFPEPPTLFDNYANRGTAEKSQDMTLAKTMRLEEDLKLYRDSARFYASGPGRMDAAQKARWNAVYGPITSEFHAAGLTGDALVRYKYQRYLQDYLACVAAVDKSVGQILDFLKESGLEKNTIVIYTSDQGFFLGEHGWFDKRWMFEESYRTPLLIYWPGITPQGSVNKSLVSNIDLAETFLEMAGIEIPAGMQGRSLVPLLKGRTPPDWRKSHYYHYYEYPGYHMVKKHYGVSTERYKLIHYYYDIDEWELYDMQTDPLEMKNVYNDPAYAKVCVSLHQKLDELVREYGDSTAIAENGPAE